VCVFSFFHFAVKRYGDLQDIRFEGSAPWVKSTLEQAFKSHVFFYEKVLGIARAPTKAPEDFSLRRYNKT
jgi:hypothetical protein